MKGIMTNGARTPPERLMRLTKRFLELTEEVPSRLGIRPAPEVLRLGLALALRTEALAWLRSLPASASRSQLLDMVNDANRRLADSIAQNADGIRDLARWEFDRATERMDEFADGFEKHPGEELEDLLDGRTIACELSILLGALGEDRGALDRRLATIDAQLRKHPHLIHRIVFGEQPRWIGDIPEEYWWLRMAQTLGPR